jgi:hypothetical protein
MRGRTGYFFVFSGSRNTNEQLGAVYCEQDRIPRRTTFSRPLSGNVIA